MTDASSTPRRCRSCGTAYEFPLPGSAATRTHCADCAALPLAFRRALERLQRRISKLEKGDVSEDGRG